MISYLGKAFCGSEVRYHTCGREATLADEAHAAQQGLPIAYSKFCG